MQAFLPLLRAGTAKTIVVIGTGGILYSVVRKIQMQDAVAYSATKAAAAMITTKYALQLAPEGFTVVTLTPGLVDTSATDTDRGKHQHSSCVAM